MWVNSKYEVNESIAWLKDFIDENTLSTIIAHEPVRVAHMPVELLIPQGGTPKLQFHLPVVDPIADALLAQSLVTVVIHGPQQYISPSLYQDAGLPTFNYGVAEVTDHCRMLTQQELSGHLERLMLERETMFAGATGATPWTMDAIARKRFDQLLPMVAGFEVDLERIQLKLKMGQNRSGEDRRRTVDRMRAAPGTDPRVTSIMEDLLSEPAAVCAAATKTEG